MEQTCFCSSDLIITNFTAVGPLPFVIEFNVSDLMPHTSYCVQAVGDYGTEITGGIGTVQLTDSKSANLHETPMINS